MTNDHGAGHRAAARAVRLDGVPEARTAFVEIDGVDVHYATAGTGTVPLLLFHHFYGNVVTWRALMTQLHADARLVAFDRPGFGWTQRLRPGTWNGTNPYRREGAQRLALGLLDHLGIERAVMVGASFGGTVALELAAAHPDRVAGLVLLAPAINGDVGPPAPLRPLLRTAAGRVVGRRIVRRMARGITPARVGNGWADPTRVTEADMAAYAAPLDAPDWDIGLWQVLNAEGPPDLRAVLPTIEHPALLLVGQHDRVVLPEWVRWTADQLPHGHLVVIPDAGHTPHEERPDVVADHVRAFIASLELS